MKKDLKDSVREMDRAIFRSENEIKMARQKLEKMVKKGENKNICRQYAQNVLAAQKNKEKLLNNKARIQDVQFSIDNMFAQAKMSQALGDVTGIMQKCNGIMNIQEISKVSASLQMNLEKMGIVTEMVDDLWMTLAML